MPPEQDAPVHPSPDVILAVRKNAAGLCALAGCGQRASVETSYIEATIELNGKPVRYRARFCDRHYLMVKPAEDYMHALKQLERDAP